MAILNGINSREMTEEEAKERDRILMDAVDVFRNFKLVSEEEVVATMTSDQKIDYIISKLWELKKEIDFVNQRLFIAQFK